MGRRGTAEERKAQIRRAASRAFAAGGLHGVSVDVIAHDVGISEAYVFRLFGSKRALFIDVVLTAFDTMIEGMAAAAGEASGVTALTRMGNEYTALLADRERLLLQMQGFAACSDPVVLEAVRGAFGRLWSSVEELSGLDPVGVKVFIALGMLTNNLAALDISEVQLPWAEHAATYVPEWLFDRSGPRPG